MKKFLLIVSLTWKYAISVAQTVVKDSISLGAPITQQNARPFISDTISLGAPAAGFSYPNDIFYNMQNGSNSHPVLVIASFSINA